MATRMQQRRGTTEQWLLANPILSAGEIGFESDSGFFKIGDGVNQWADLAYFETAASFAASLADYIATTEKGAANGVAELDANGNVPISQLGNIIDGAPGVLDTLQELATALNNDADFFTTITGSITDGDAATLTSAQSYTDTALANFTTLPDQNAHTGEYLTTDGTNASWAPLTLDKAVGDLTDVTLTTPADGDALVYDSATSSWVNGVVDVAGAIATANAYTDSSIAAIPPTDLTGYATETYVDNSVAALVDSAPGTLDTLNELAAALGDDANFATTVTNAIAAKAPSSNPEFTVNAVSSYIPPSGVNAKPYDPSGTSIGATITINSVFSNPGYSVGDIIYLTGTTTGGQSIDNINVQVMVSSSSMGWDLKVEAVNPADDAAVIAWGNTFANISSGVTIYKPSILTIGSSELGYLDGLSSGIQTQLNSKAALTHSHSISEVSTLQTALDAKASRLLSFVSVSTSRTLALTDADKMIEASSSISATTLTVPTDASVNFPVGTTINITQVSAGTVNVAAASGVTLNFTPSNTLRTQWSSAVLVKRAANTWLLSGDLL